MSPPAQRRRKGLTLNPVPRWFPGKGTALLAPPVRLFYSSQVRANLGWWKSHKAPKAVIRCLEHGLKLDFIDGPPTPLKTSPLLVSDADTDFVLQDLAKGDKLGAYQPLLPGAASFLARSRVHTQPGGKRRIVLNFRHVNAACVKRACRYESIKDLSSILQPNNYLLSLDLSAAFWHIPLHPSAARYLSFHFALSLRYTDAQGLSKPTPVPAGA